ncbi:MAG: sodium transporter, partial [Cyclobacteriaceae bacterium]|nr:sodium transporter [Cyclobacteriaceae bacterium]
SLASVFNSCSTLFTVDIYKKLRPHTPEIRLVKVGRIATVIAVVLGILWIPIMANISGVLYEYLQKIQAYIAAPIAAVFLLGIFYKRINAHGAYATLVTGFGIGMLRIFLEIIQTRLAAGSFLHTLATINFLTFGAYFFLFCVVLAVVVSFATAPQDEAQLAGLTFGTISDEEKAKTKNSYNWVDIVVSIAILAIVAMVMITFNGT